MVVPCQKCKHENNITTTLSAIANPKYLEGNIKEVVDLNDDIKLTFSFPKVSSLKEFVTEDDDGLEELAVLKNSIEQIEFNGEVVDFRGNEYNTFLNALDTKIFEKLNDFLDNNKFGLDVNLKFTCVNEECAEENDIDLSESLYDFF